MAVGLAAGYYGRRLIAESRIGAAEEEAARIMDESTKEAEARKKEIYWKAKKKFTVTGRRQKRIFVTVAANWIAWKGG